MRRLFTILAIIALIPAITSCIAPSEAVKGTGRGTAEIVEGAGRGTVDLGKGAVVTVKETAKATGELLTGRGDAAVVSGKSAISSGAEGIKNVIVKPVEGLEKGLAEIDKGIKRATGSEEIK
ncbi:MAG: hypothetical protein ABID09_02280 [Candidatus Omnitrophota bacterium]